MRTIAGMLAAGLALGGCAALSMPARPGPALVDKDTCNVAQYTTLVGKPVSDAGVPPVSQMVRIIGPADQITMDLQPARLNIEVNSSGVITNIKCG